MRLSRLSLFASLACFALLAGCGKKEDAVAPTEPTTDATPTTSTEAPAEDAAYAGWKTLTGKNGAYTIMVPATYTSSTESPEEIDKVIKAIEKAQPELAATFNGTAKNEKLDLYAMDLSAESASDGFADNVNIIVEDWAPSGDLATNLKAVGEATVKTMPSRAPMTTEMLDLMGTKVFKYTGSMVFPGGAGKELTSDLTGFLVPHDGKIYIVSLSTKEGDASKSAETFEKIIKSMTWK